MFAEQPRLAARFSPVCTSVSVNRVPHGPQATFFASTSIPGLYFRSSGQRSNSASQMAPSRAKKPPCRPSAAPPDQLVFGIPHALDRAERVQVLRPDGCNQPHLRVHQLHQFAYVAHWRAPISAMNT